jgi:hypothetical protein
VYKLEKIEKPVPEDELKRASLKTAAARGPVKDALEGWNSLHDIEYELEKAAKEYDMAASYPGTGAAEAKKMMQQIDEVKKALEKISHVLFTKLIEDEMAFVKKFGTPDEFAESERRRIFPASVANKIARSLLAGVSVFVKDFKSKDMLSIEQNIQKGLKGFGEQNYRVELDGGTYSDDHTGTVNVYVNNPDFADKIFRDLSDWVGHLHLVGINGRVRLETSKSTQGPVVRVEIIKNEDEKFGGMSSTDITYSTWRSVLDWLGLDAVAEESGSMPIRDYLAAYKHPADFSGKAKEAVFARQIAMMATTALKHGYKEIAWA